MHDYKKGRPLHLVCTSAVFAPGKPSPSCLPLFFATSSVPSHLTPPLSPCVGPIALPEPRATPRPEGPSPSLPLSFGAIDRAKGPAPSPSLSSGAIDRASELRLSVIHPPLFDSTPGTVSGRCAEVHGCFSWTSSRGSSSRWLSPAAPRRALRVVWTSMWSVHGLRFGPRHARRRPIAWGNICA
jgi:hypothetical protein